MTLVLRSLFLAVALGLAAPGMASDFLVIRTAPINLEERAPGIDQVGRLVWRGGLTLVAEHDDFGGISGIEQGAGGRLIAITDLGWRFDFVPTFDDDGHLRDIQVTRFDRLQDQSGTPLRGKSQTDAESLVRLSDGRLAVSFERNHRLAELDGVQVGPALHTPADLSNAPNNGGLEAIAQLADGRLLLITEDMDADNNANAAWRGVPGAWEAVSYSVSGGFKPTAATTMPGGDIVVVERFYTPLTGVACRIRLIDAETANDADVISGDVLATLRPPMTVDNLEAVTTLEVDGETLLIIASDDNLNRGTQRNLLLAFQLKN